MRFDALLIAINFGTAHVVGSNNALEKLHDDIETKFSMNLDILAYKNKRINVPN